jgi:outer membrane protein
MRLRALTRPRGAPRRIGAAAPLVLAALAAGCAPRLSSPRSVPGTAPSPAEPWKPPPGIEIPKAARKAAPPEIPKDLEKPGATVTLEQVIDVALRNNPDTRAAWLNAVAAAAHLGSQRSSYLPEIDLNGTVTRLKSAAVGGQFNFIQTNYGPSVALSYLLLDFGGRNAQVEQARQQLLAANWTQDAVIQSIVLQVEQAYYQYLNAKALRDAEQASLKEAQANLDAANERHRAGVATIADVLQARTALSQAQLNLETVEGQIQTVQGSLATAMGLPATTKFEVGVLPEEIPVTEVDQAVDGLIRRAESQRPDLAAARSQALQAASRIQEVRSAGLPDLSLTANAGRTFYYNSVRNPSTTYSWSVLFHFPVFTGFKNSYDVRQARAQAAAAEQQAESLEQQIVLQVWTSYYSLKTATQRLKTSKDLLASALQSEQVASGRYKAGVGGILDLLSAEAALASARAQEVQSRSDWLVAVAQLAHDTGSLNLPSEQTAPASAPVEQKGTP